MEINNKQSGYAVIISLVLLSVILAGALITASIVLRDQRIANVLELGGTAFYGAETAAEDGMYQIVNSDIDTVISQGLVSGVFSNGVTWEREAFNTSNSLVIDFVDDGNDGYFDVYNTANVNQAAGAGTMTISYSGTGALDVGIREWDGVSLGAEAITSCVAGSCPSFVLDPSLAYSVRVQPQLFGVSDIILETFASNGNPLAVEVPVTVQAKGIFQGTEQAVEISLPTSPPWG